MKFPSANLWPVSEVDENCVHCFECLTPCPIKFRITGYHSTARVVISVVFISEHSEFELIGDKYAEAVLQNGGGLERMSGGERQRCQSREGHCRSWEVPGNAMSGIGI